MSTSLSVARAALARAPARVRQIEGAAALQELAALGAVHAHLQHELGEHLVVQLELALPRAADYTAAGRNSHGGRPGFLVAAGLSGLGVRRSDRGRSDASNELGRQR